MNKYFDSVDSLHRMLFSEEYDFMFDSTSDLNDRNRGINPMNSDYQKKIAQKRALFEVSPLNEVGLAIDNSSRERCIEEIEANRLGQETKFTKEVIKWIEKQEESQLSYQEKMKKTAELRSRIDIRDPHTWTDVMILNSYALLVETDRWELSDSMSLDEFKERIFTDPDFAERHAPSAGMESEHYQPNQM